MISGLFNILTLNCFFFWGGLLKSTPGIGGLKKSLLSRLAGGGGPRPQEPPLSCALNPKPERFLEGLL